MDRGCRVYIQDCRRTVPTFISGLINNRSRICWHKRRGRSMFGHSRHCASQTLVHTQTESGRSPFGLEAGRWTVRMCVCLTSSLSDFFGRAALVDEFFHPRPSTSTRTAGNSRRTCTFSPASLPDRRTERLVTVSDPGFGELWKERMHSDALRPRCCLLRAQAFRGFLIRDLESSEVTSRSI